MFFALGLGFYATTRNNIAMVPPFWIAWRSNIE
jgi:hypothetical protein